ncbi:hypothetical protein COOONC_12110 [Cooperia oncophora]
MLDSQAHRPEEISPIPPPKINLPKFYVNEEVSRILGSIPNPLSVIAKILRMQPIIQKRKEQQNTNARDERGVICEKSVEKRLCWKCYSSEHSSRECTRENCMLCGKLHHIRLCFSTENAGDANSNIRQTHINLNRSPKRDQLLNEQKQQPKTRTLIKMGTLIKIEG